MYFLQFGFRKKFQQRGEIFFVFYFSDITAEKRSHSKRFVYVFRRRSEKIQALSAVFCYAPAKEAQGACRQTKRQKFLFHNRLPHVYIITYFFCLVNIFLKNNPAINPIKAIGHFDCRQKGDGDCLIYAQQE